MSKTEVRIRANAIQLMMAPSGLVNGEGVISSNLSLDAGGARLTIPAQAFPFLKPGEPALVTISIVQCTPEEVAESPTLIDLNGRPLQ